MEDEIKQEVEQTLAIEQHVIELEQSLSDNPQFQAFLSAQKEFKQKSETVWAWVEAKMIEHDIKTIKGTNFTLTIAERMNFDINLDELPAKFIKKVPDTKRIGDTYKLEGKVKGVQVTFKKSLTKRLK